MIITDKTYPESGQYPYPTGGVPRYTEDPKDNVSKPLVVGSVIPAKTDSIGSGFTQPNPNNQQDFSEQLQQFFEKRQPKDKDPRIEKYPHYFKDVSHIDFIDVYTIIRLWNITDPSIAHALKKLIVSGGRGGGKSKLQDIQEAIDSLERFKELEVLLSNQESVTK